MEDAIWLAVCEVSVRPGDLPSGFTKAFGRATTWADSLETVKKKVSQCLESYEWELIAIEDARPIDDCQDYSAETTDLVARTRQDGKATLLGRFYSYKEN